MIYGSISQIQCHVSVITDKNDLSFQLTYHMLTFDFQTTSAEGYALLNMSRVQQTVVLDLRTFYDILIRKNACLKYTHFSTLPTYQLSCHERLIISKTIKENTKRYTENTLHRRKIEMVNARLLVKQFTHPVHPNSSFRLSYLLRQWLWTKREKYDRQAAQTKYKRKKNKQDSTQANTSLKKKVIA